MYGLPPSLEHGLNSDYWRHTPSSSYCYTGEQTMPYKRVGKTVFVKRGGEWFTLKTHPSAAKAEAHRRALEANVKHK